MKEVLKSDNLENVSDVYQKNPQTKVWILVV